MNFQSRVGKGKYQQFVEEHVVIVFLCWNKNISKIVSLQVCTKQHRTVTCSIVKISNLRLNSGYSVFESFSRQDNGTK